MSPTRLIILAAGLAMVACDGGSAVEPSVYVPASWHEYRRGEGHLEHLREDVKCNECHAVGGSGFETVSGLICERCHDTRDAMHRTSKAPMGECLECHGFKEVTEVRKDGCQRCHNGEVAVAAEVHTKDCAKCHHPHQSPTNKPSDCLGCHEGVSTRVHTTIANPVEACASCHGMHKKEMNCESCHQDRAGAKTKGHDTCINCHIAHDKPKDCSSCHEKKRTLGHKDCVACHDPHDIQRSAVERCDGCHSDVLVDHRPRDVCSNCHVGHASNSTAKDCTSCHDNAPTDRALHGKGVDCKRCHQPHQIVIAPSTDMCSTCHVAVVQALDRREGHDVCEDCHLGSAHTPGRTTDACARCHAPQHRSAPKGHQDCKLCHEPHSGATPKKACIDCHTAKKSHGKIEDCQRCHAPHGPDRVVVPPSCSTCHSNLPLLHGASGHQDCSTCHLAHGPPASSERADCLKCHQDQVAHEPEAATCRGCHQFKL